MKQSNGSEPGRGLPGLIPDHALEPEDADRFAHEDLVDQLKSIVTGGLTSVNIGLFGPWGSGKTGISRRLRHRLENEAPDEIEYVELNALKYSSAPLLRSFMSQVAEQTLPEQQATKLRKRLYENSVRPSIKLPDRWYTAGRNVIIALVALVVVYAIALWQLSGSAQAVLSDVATSVLPTAIPVAALVALAVRIIPLMSAKIETLAPSEPEQFERAFREDLLKPLKIDGTSDRRLVIFIDELDRCAPGEVAETLETLRTFLHIPGVLCIVAADRQVLEQALTKRVRQATPSDVTNPYYSAGSAYLDKIFELQLDLPSLQAARLVDFALGLVDGADGVWSETDQADDIVSVLLPVHVQSPRRVKVLLNRFALAFELARKRHADGKLSPGPHERVEELAKLVCLRAEFPLFTLDLEDEPRLAELIVRARDHLDRGHGPDDHDEHDSTLASVDAAVCRRAFAYANGLEPVAPILSGKDEPRTEGPSRVEQAHGLQLVNYLRKTRNIANPRRDLIHLESAGSVRGLEPQTAEELETAALNNDPGRVIDAIRNLGADDANAALLMLGDRLRASKGNDADNLVRVLLAAIEEVGVEVRETAVALIGFVQDYADRNELADDLLPGALRLAALGRDRELTAVILQSDAASQPPLTELRLELGNRLGEPGDQIADLLANAIVDSPERVVDLLSGWERDDSFRQLLVALAEPLGAILASARKIGEEEAAEDVEARTEPIAAAIASVSDEFANAAETEAAELVAVALTTAQAGHKPYYMAESALRRRRAPIQTPELANATLVGCTGWTLGSWPPIVRDVDLNAATNDAATTAADLMASKLLQNHSGTEIASGLAALGDVVRRLGKDVLPQPLAANTFDKLAGEPATSLGDTAKIGVFRLAEQLVSLGLLTSDIESERRDQFVAELLGLPSPDEEDEREQRRSFVADAIRDGEEQRETLELLEACEWLTESERFELRVVGLSGTADPYPDGDAVAALIESEGEAAVDAVATWLDAARPAGAEIDRALSRWLDRPPPTKIRAPLTRYLASLPQQDITAMTIARFRQAWPSEPPTQTLTVINTARSEQTAVAEEIVRLADSVPVSKREPALRLWEVLSPTDPRAQRCLIDGVLHPMIEGGKTSYVAVRRRLSLVANPPSGRKQALVEAIEANAPDEDTAKAMRKAMEEVGLKPKRKKHFGPFKF